MIGGSSKNASAVTRNAGTRNALTRNAGTRNAMRKRLGQYYTPPPLVDLLLRFALDPSIEGASDLERIKICDPACGTGHFLIPAAERLARAISVRTGQDGRSALRHVVRHQLFGVDLDADAVATCINRLAVLTDLPMAELGSTIRVGDALAAVIPPDAKFDVILGNPPYVNGIEGSIPGETRARLKGRFPSVRGTADLSHYFLARSIELLEPGGRIGLVVPRGILNAPACSRLRETLPPGLRPNLIYMPEHCGWFADASVFACALVLGPDETCRVSDAQDFNSSGHSAGRVDGANWWSQARRILGNPADAAVDSARRVGDAFEVVASLTTGDAYDLRAAIVDASDASGPKLVTTGLIDPRRCDWGDRTCRYLGTDYRHPRADPSRVESRSLIKRLQRSRRPKVLVAGLTRRVECFFDPGECLGSVSTYSIFHPHDDEAALKKLCEHLLSDGVTRRFIAELGGNGMRGRHVTMKKSFLLNLPLPDEPI